MNTTATSARQAAWRLAFDGGRAPLAYEMDTDPELLPLVRQAAHEASPDECLHELARVRALCERAREVAAGFRAGRYASYAAALAALRDAGVGDDELDRAFGAALVWTAI